MSSANDIVDGLKGKVVNKANGRKKVVLTLKLKNKLGYDGCGAHTHK